MDQPNQEPIQTNSPATKHSRWPGLITAIIALLIALYAGIASTYNFYCAMFHRNQFIEKTTMLSATMQQQAQQLQAMQTAIATLQKKEDAESEKHAAQLAF